MNNFSAHYSDVELSPSLFNIKICWLSANSTSQFQSLDQRIIQFFKVYYCWQWLSFMLDCFNKNQNSMTFMNLHLAIWWTVWSWNQHLLHTTVYNCFWKSTLLATLIILLTVLFSADLSQLYNSVLQADYIHDAMTITNFLNPVKKIQTEEENSTESEKVLKEILEEHLNIQTSQDDDEDGQQSEQSVYSIQNA